MGNMGQGGTQNPGLLAAVGRGLRAGGGVLNPAVYETQVRERLLEEEKAQARKDDLFKLVLTGVQEGLFAPEVGRKALLSIRPDLVDQLPEGAIGIGMAAKREQAKFDQEQRQLAARRRINNELGLPEDAPDPITRAAYEAAHPAPKALEIDQLISLEEAARAKGHTKRADILAERIKAINYRRPAVGPQPLRSDAVNLLLPDGGRATGREMPDGSLQRLTESGYAPVPPGTQVMSLQGVGTPAQLGAGKSDFKDLRNTKIATRQAIATADELIGLVKGRPDVLSVSGGLTRIADTVFAQAEGIARLTGVEMLASKDPGSYADELGKIAGPAARSTEAQAAIVALAYATALANDPGGRITEQDVKSAIRQIGAATGSPDTLISVLESFKKRLDRNYSIRAQEISGETPSSLLGGGASNSAPNAAEKVREVDW